MRLLDLSQQGCSSQPLTQMRLTLTPPSSSARDTCFTTSVCNPVFQAQQHIADMVHMLGECTCACKVLCSSSVAKEGVCHLAAMCFHGAAAISANLVTRASCLICPLSPPISLITGNSACTRHPAIILAVPTELHGNFHKRLPFSHGVSWWTANREDAGSNFGFSGHDHFNSHMRKSARELQVCCALYMHP